MDMIKDMYGSLEKSLTEGESFNQWKKQYKDLWKNNGWTGKQAWRVDNIFRTNIQTAYNVGRYSQMSKVVDNRPFWMYNALNDTRTRATHLALNGKVFKYDHEFWDIFFPPNGFRCRCTVITLSQRQINQKGLQVEKLNPYGGLIEPIDPITKKKMPARPLMPDRGFEGNPAKQHYSPDFKKYPDWLKQAYEDFVVKAIKSIKVSKITTTATTIDRLKKFTPTFRSEVEIVKQFEVFLDKEIGNKDPLEWIKQIFKEAPKNRKITDIISKKDWDNLNINKVSKKFIQDKFNFAIKYLDEDVFNKLSKNKCKIKTTSKDRAFYVQNTIMVNKLDDDYEIYLHEFGHHIEEVLNSYKLSAAWRDNRAELTGSLTKAKLKDIDNKSYDDNEVAVTGEFIDKYVGKCYIDNTATEVVSMGFQQFSSIDDLHYFYKKDKGHFSFITGILSGAIKK